MPPRVQDVETRFWSKVDKGGDCWLWTGFRNHGGYGKFYLPGGKVCVRAHRWAYETYVGRVEPDQVVMHVCDTPSCVRPDHLQAGSQQQNVSDCVAKGRKANGLRRALMSARKLTTLDVETVLNRVASGESQAAVAADFNVHPSLVSRIVNRKRWVAASP